MLEEADAAQARELLRHLYAHVEEISEKLEAAEWKARETQRRGENLARRESATLRRELYHVHRLIDGLHGRFPGTRPQRRWQTRTA
jgi:hypothetical protein